VRWAYVLLAPLCLLVWSSVALAQPQVTASFSVENVEVGEPFQLTIEALTDSSDEPHSPRVSLPRGLIKTSPRIASRTTMNFGGGRSRVRRGIKVTWQITASEPGTYTVAAPTVIIGNKTVAAGSRLRVKVHPVGSGFQRRRGGGRSLFSFPFATDDTIDDEPPEPEVLSDDARSLVMRKEPQRFVFLRAMVDKNEAYVGEQITLSYYVYYRANFEMADRHEPTLGDFSRVPIDKDPGAAAPIITTVGRFRYHVKLLERVAIFPLRAGKLRIGKLSAKFTGRRVGSLVQRESNDLELTVKEPPVEDRPLGYRVGDVGKFHLSAEVTPRETRQGGSVSVMVKLSGMGKLPGRLRIPERTGVEWLDPEKREEISVRRGRVSGWRTFGYVARVSEPGEVSLGEIRLPCFDPATDSYRVARVNLGNVLVQKKEGIDLETEATGAGDDAFANIVPPRLQLSDYEPRVEAQLAPRTLWTMVVAPPTGVVLALGGFHLVAGVRRRRERKKRDAGSLALDALREMSKAGDIKSAAAKAEKSIHLAIEAATQLKSRALLLEELRDQLAERNVDEDLAQELLAVLEACSSARFEPDAEEGAIADLTRRARGLVKRLLKLRSTRGGGASDEVAA